MRMLFHTQFVAAACSAGRFSGSRGACRQIHAIAQAAAGMDSTVIGLAWMGLVAWKPPNVLPWIAWLPGLVFGDTISY